MNVSGVLRPACEKSRSSGGLFSLTAVPDTTVHKNLVTETPLNWSPHFTILLFRQAKKKAQEAEAARATELKVAKEKEAARQSELAAAARERKAARARQKAGADAAAAEALERKAKKLEDDVASTPGGAPAAGSTPASPKGATPSAVSPKV